MHCVVAVASSASTTDDGTARRRRCVAASSHWLALCRLSSTIRFLIYLEFHEHSIQRSIQHYISVIQNADLSQSSYPVKLLSCSRKLYIS